MIKKIILWISVIGMSLVIFDFSTHTGEESSGLSVKIAEYITDIVEKIIMSKSDRHQEIFDVMHFLIRKGAHFTEFAILGILSFLLVRSYGLTIKNGIFIGLTYCILFAVCDEIHQLFVAGRSGNIVDVCIDSAGSLTGIALCSVVCWRKKQKKI